MKAAIVCGGRDYGDRWTLEEVMRKYALDYVIEGGAEGADDLAGKWAERAGVGHACVGADWESLKKPAGCIRNGWMLALLKAIESSGYRVAVIAFPGGTGTADMVKQARAAGVRVIEVPA